MYANDHQKQSSYNQIIACLGYWIDKNTQDVDVTFT